LGELGIPGIAAVTVIVTFLSTAYAVLWIKGEKFSFLIEGLSYRKHPVKDIYLFGFEVLELIRYRYSTLYDRKMERYFKTLYGLQYSEYYRRINMAQKISAAVLAFIFFSILSVAINDWLVFVIAFAGSGAAAYYFDADIYEAISRRKNSIRKDFPEMLTELTLLVNAGLVLREAWRKTAMTGGGILYIEMRRTTERIDNGVPEFDAYLEFAERCADQSVDKAISAMVQNLTKGSRELVEFFRRTAAESWNERKQAVRRKGEEASTKMLIPIGLMFLGILLMIMMPIMGNMTY
jgi:tight adherence protein C